MRRTRFVDMNCAAAQALEQIGDWWTLLLIREALYGTDSFSGFVERLGISRNILTDRLDRLVKDGIFRREPGHSGTTRLRYRLTGKGHDLLPVLVVLMQWGDKWILGPERVPLRLLDRDDRKPILPVTVRASDGRPLKIADLAFRPGPGASASTLKRFESIRAAGAGVKRTTGTGRKRR